MAIQLMSTRDAARSAGVKVMTYGVAGAGKTMLCATTGGSPVVISAEAGLMSLRRYDLPCISVATIADVHEAYTFLLQSQEGKQFNWICLDSISEIAEVVLAAEKKANKDPRAAYGALSDQMMDLLRSFRDMPDRNVYMSAKLERVKDEQTGAVMFGPSMPGQRLAQSIPYLFDEVFVLRAEKDQEGKLQRWLQTQPDFTYTAKDRSGSLDMFELPDLAAIAAKIAADDPAAMPTAQPQFQSQPQPEPAAEQAA